MTNLQIFEINHVGLSSNVFEKDLEQSFLSFIPFVPVVLPAAFKEPGSSPSSHGLPFCHVCSNLFRYRGRQNEPKCLQELWCAIMWTLKVYSANYVVTAVKV